MPTKHLLHKLLTTESEWNPKVMLGRAALYVLPERFVHRLKKSYYAHLLKHSPQDWIVEEDALVAGKLIDAGDTVLDIGASLGTYTLFLSRCVGQSGKVYSFEPIPETFDFLTNNITKLGLKNVTALNVALSDSDRSGSMVIPRWRWGQECWYDARMKDELAHPSWRVIDVQLRTLDSLSIDNGRKIKFIKCDAERHELAVLSGGAQTIRNCMPAMLIEIAGNPDDASTKAAATFSLLRCLGYKAYCFDGTTVTLRQSGQRSQNYFFLTPEHVERLQEMRLLSGTVA